MGALYIKKNVNFDVIKSRPLKLNLNTNEANDCCYSGPTCTVEGKSAIWWRNLFSEKRLSRRFSAFGQWAIQIWWILAVSITSSEIFKELCLTNYLTWRPVYCYFEKRITLNLEKKADCLKIFIRTNYVLAVRVGWHLFCLWRAAQVRASIKLKSTSRLDVDEWSLKYLEHGMDGETKLPLNEQWLLPTTTILPSCYH